MIKINWILLCLIFFTFTNSYAQSEIISQGAEWKYLDDGSNQGTAWSQTAYDDSSWDVGNAQLGFGDGDEQTELSAGAITYYFRHTFIVTDPNTTSLLLLELLRDDGAIVYINGTEVLRSNMPSGNIDYLTLSSSTVSGSEEDLFYEYEIASNCLVAGDNLIAVEIHQRGSSSSDISLDLRLSFITPPLIVEGANWKYLDDGSNQGSAWKESSFDDSSWANGDAQLGYGDGDEETVLSYGGNSSNKYITTYFRHEFTVENPNFASSLSLEILRDDGAVVYLNGTEVVRSNMPTGSINYETLAASSIGGSAEDIFNQYIISSDELLAGNNVIAVEIHQRSSTSSDISMDLRLSFTEVDYLRKAPYLLHTGDNTTAHILWQLDQTHDCTLSWGTDLSYSSGSVISSEYGDDHQHSNIITGLTPNTKYYYKVEVSVDEIKTGSFQTGIADSSPSATFYAYGDTRTYPSHHNDVAEQIVLDYTANPNDQTFIISSGDIVSNGNNEADWDEQFFDPSYTYIQQMLSELPYAVSIGNHEGQGTLFGKYFPFSMFESDRYYYSMDYGPIHFIVIDQFTDYSVGSDQYNWIVNDLASSTKPWKVMMFHKPAWSAGGHSNDSQAQTVLQPLCLTYGVQLVLSGHNHYYSRAMVDGVIHITTGGGGAPLYSPNPNGENIVKVDESYHFCKFNIQDTTLNCTVIRSDGSEVESFTSYLNGGGSSSGGGGETTEFNIKLYLEGAFNGTGLNTALTDQIPLSQPFNTAPWNYSGNEILTSLPANMVDWILVEIRDAANSSLATPATMVGKKAAILLSDGQVKDVDGENLHIDLSYSQHPYIVIYHRNHLAFMSASPPFDDDGILTYNFTYSSGQIYGGATGSKELASGVWGMAGGDGNADGNIDNQDLIQVWKVEAGSSNYSKGDFNLNLQTDHQDKNEIWLNNNGKQSEVPQ